LSDIPTILRVIQMQRAALLRGDVATLRRYANQWRAIEEQIKEASENLAYRMMERKADGKPVSQNMLLQDERYQALIKQTRQQIDGYARQLAPQIESEQQRLWEQGQVDASEQIARVVGAFNRLPVDSTNTIIGTTADGSPLLNTLRASWPSMIAPLTAELIRGVAMGVNPRVVARRMAVATQSSLKRMLTVARTEQLRAYRESSRKLYQHSGLNEYKRMAAKNNRTCPLCLADDGKIYKTVEPMPIHPNCRCTSIPIIEGYTIDTGKTGAEWFAEQSPETQRQMLGPSRYEMYKQGTPLSAFSKVRNDLEWGKTLVKLPIDKIVKGGTISGEPWWLTRYPALRALGSVLRVDDDGEHVVQQHLEELALLPDTLHKKLVAAGLQDVHFGKKSMPYLDANQQYRNAQPRGWPPGSTWDEVAGAYNRGNKSVVAGWTPQGHGSRSAAIHEYGHAIGDLLGYNDHPALDAAQRRLYDKLNPYLQQGGPGGAAGKSELLAEGMAHVVVNRWGAIRDYDEEFVKFIESILYGDE
jgi:SPP1 gp7 family putative phage head morphogenesis protein